ncbi:TPA: allophanate hydrolase [Cronobacter sakazakii]|uniref:allophanate hydrolase n=8 Tax=Cronobacter sakazakii TaxID=28141 RepID=UPI001375A2AB|nr:allophanate hydrolase [Cronobacter sakazakii]NCH08646.1 allophanate hydrolase [Cronobacter sakazakii]HDK7239051.1 allophanate hydrolase [Cronobacter sakazakii]HDK7255149.1 allophanate hydrolase [Cronobacter sakazakii]HDK7325023.1 allophanate hydrolase [Cronobacter sakazakii]
MSQSSPLFTPLTLAEWRREYQDDPTRITDIYSAAFTNDENNDPAWITRASASHLEAQIAPLLAAINEGKSLADFPLFGVPFAVKDNIDVAGLPTTAACPAFAYTPQEDVTVVAKLKAAGAIVLGKTNLDQFATGLVGTRSPYGAVPNTFNPAYVSGGSSAGSASTVARGLVAFALGTDTAGSGRVPAGFNNIVGLKPTKGWLSNRGVVPACRLNDCVSVFALSAADAFQVASLAGGYDAADAYSRANPRTAPARLPAQPRFAVPDAPEFYGDRHSEAAYRQSLTRLEALGATLVPVDFTPFRTLAEQLYQGAWVAERTVAVGEMLNEPADVMDPTVRDIVEGGLKYTACDAWQAEYIRAALARQIAQVLETVDALVVPTSPTIHTLDEMKAEPVRYNSHFGYYTNFTNLADLCALALPGDFRDDGLPAGITLIAPAWHDAALAHFGALWQQAVPLPLGATNKALPAAEPFAPSPHHVRLAVVGAHLRGMPLNHQLTTRDAVFIEETTTAADYRLYALANTTPPKPGLVRADSGQPIVVELWDIPLARFGEFVAEIPPPLGIGTLTLADGRAVKGFICEPQALGSATDITEWGGWKAWLARHQSA